MLRYLGWSYVVTVIGLILAAGLGWIYSGTLIGLLGFLMVAAVLSVLEISLSFDNAIVNASKLEKMTLVWRRRFLTWGILIAVFGMRIVFPLLIVVIAARVGPIEAVRLAAMEPARYAEIINDAHISIAAFGGAFLMMVALKYFLDEAKDVDWIVFVERRLRRLGSLKSSEVGLVLLIIGGVSSMLGPEERGVFLYAATMGLIVYLAVDFLGEWLDRSDATDTVAKGGLGAFLYLEVLDASFSFDGVIGAFALTQNLFLIAIGLGIGAMYVRSMTIMLVEQKSLSSFRYLEHGAFWSILVLSIIMFSQAVANVPEYVTGILGAGFICCAFLSSLHHRKREGEKTAAADMMS